MRRAYSIIIIGVLANAAPAAEQPHTPNYIEGEGRTVIINWLNKNPNLRLALDDDCGCQERIQAIRTGTYGVGKANPQYHPYYAVGDFNNDASMDIAIIAVETADPENSTLVIFNGPLNRRNSAEPAFASKKLRGALFYGASRLAPFRLVIGAFNSEGAALEPKGGTYEAVEDEQ